MANPKTCRHLVLAPYGWSMAWCLSCDQIFKRNDLPFGRTVNADYIWDDEYSCWEYLSPKRRH